MRVGAPILPFERTAHFLAGFDRGILGAWLKPMRQVAAK